MSPLSIQNSQVVKSSDGPMPSVTYSGSNRRASASPVQRAYPILLFLSTLMAAVFCLMYITKPVISRAASQPVTVPIVASPIVKPEPPGAKPAISPVNATSAPTTLAPALPPISSAFESTNLRIQHILTAEAPGGHLAKIDLEVPVLYQSRNLRWTAQEVTEARELLAQLSNFQEKSKTLRTEGTQLLDRWNHLVSRSLPVSDLRADSPSLPSNQQDAADAPRPAGLDTTELIKIQPAGK